MIPGELLTDGPDHELNPGRRTACTRVPATSAPRASGWPWIRSRATPMALGRTAPSFSASSRAVPLGASTLSSWA